MTYGCEILSACPKSLTSKAILDSMAAAAAMPVVETSAYQGNHDWLMMWGIGRAAHSEACKQHVKTDRHVVLWDMGYLGRAKGNGYLRLSIDGWHPEKWFDRTEPDPTRWNVLGATLTNESEPSGHIVLVGMGPKSHAYTGERNWEVKKLRELQKRYPNHRIVFRPKPNKPIPVLPCEIAASGSVKDVLRGASLVVCRHSNVAVDAVLMGIPFECDEGAAKWLQDKPYTKEARLDFLRRLAWWQWRPAEADQAWKFILKVTA